jgi:hypothetical protein
MLQSTAAWAEFLDMLIARGAVGVKLQAGPDGAVTGLECSFRAPVTTAVPPPRRVPEDEKPERKSLPPGLGYG